MTTTNPLTTEAIVCPSWCRVDHGEDRDEPTVVHDAEDLHVTEAGAQLGGHRRAAGGRSSMTAATIGTLDLLHGEVAVNFGAATNGTWAESVGR
jgi:hypothetical protein